MVGEAVVEWWPSCEWEWKRVKSATANEKWLPAWLFVFANGDNDVNIGISREPKCDAERVQCELVGAWLTYKVKRLTYK